MAEEPAPQVDTPQVDAPPAPVDGAPPTDTPPPVDAPATVLDGAEDVPTLAPQDWPDDWRQMIAGEDDKTLKQLERVKSPADMVKRFMDAQAKISKGLKPLSINADSSDDEVAEYRHAIGLPQDVKDYDIKFSDTMKPTDADKDVLNDFRKVAFDKNIPPEQAQTILDWYESNREGQLQDMQENAQTVRAATSEELRQEWGGEYKGNLNAIQTFMETSLGEDSHKALVHKQFTDGTFLGDDPNFLRMMSGPATDHVGPNAIFSGDVEVVAQNLNERKNELLKLRGGSRDDRAKYKSDAVQSELTGIYAKLEKTAEHKARRG